MFVVFSIIIKEIKHLRYANEMGVQSDTISKR